MPELSVQIVEYASQHGRVTIGDMVTLTGTSQNTLKQHFRVPLGKTAMPCSVNSIAIPPRRKVPHEAPNRRAARRRYRCAVGQIPDGVFLGSSRFAGESSSQRLAGANPSRRNKEAPLIPSLCNLVAHWLSFGIELWPAGLPSPSS